ncbi:Sir2 family NAD-dependent protein deacetylase [Miniimonas sp. S16]|nr:Sir2 family NAD-dependent protein deacetylase [Miniimonas sp. S16]
MRTSHVGGVTVLTGAGISTSVGIPDFRGPDGVWTRDPTAERLLDIDAYVAEVDVRTAGWASWASHPAWRATPSPAHRALLALEGANALRGVVTQNFDGLHQLAGTASDLVAEVHGSLRTTSCLACGATQETPEVLARLGQDPDPHCPCGGVLKVDVVYFGEMLPGGTFERAVGATRACDVFVAVGSTLTVQPVASLAVEAVRSGARLVVVNRDPTPYDPLAADVRRGPIDVELPRLVQELLDQV